MYEVKDEDIQLSDKFKKAQLKLEIKKQELISLNKKENNDTIESSLLFLSNQSYFKELTKNQLIVSKSQTIKNYLIKSFPNLDVNVINKLLIKHGYLNYKGYAIISTVFFMLGLLLNIFWLFEIYGLSLGLIPKIVVAVCFWLVSLITFDFWLVNKKR